MANRSGPSSLCGLLLALLFYWYKSESSRASTSTFPDELFIKAKARRLPFHSIFIALCDLVTASFARSSLLREKWNRLKCNVIPPIVRGLITLESIQTLLLSLYCISETWCKCLDTLTLGISRSWRTYLQIFTQYYYQQHQF